MNLDIKKIGQEFRVSVDQVHLRFMHLTPHHDGPTAVVEIIDLSIGGRPHIDRLSLLSSRSRSSLAKTLGGRWPDHDWGKLLDDACFEVSRLMSEVVPPDELMPNQPTEDAWLVEGIIPLDTITVLYADGGSLKSWFALALAVAARRNEPLAPAARWCVRQRESVLYLDWEADQRTHAGRLWRLYRGLEIDAVQGLYYQNMKGQPLHTALPALTSTMAKLGNEVLLIVDSLGMACGDEPETAIANLRTMGALSSLPGTKLVLAHVNAQTAIAPNGVGRPYGSVFIRNVARSAVEARSEPEDHGALVTYYHRKANDGPLLRPMAIRYEFALGGGVTLHSAEPDLQHGTIADQIYDVLSEPKSVAAIAEMIGRTSTQVRVELSRMEKRSKVIQLVTGLGGRGKEGLWGRVDGKRSTDTVAP